MKTLLLVLFLSLLLICALAGRGGGSFFAGLLLIGSMIFYAITPRLCLVAGLLLALHGTSEAASVMSAPSGLVGLPTSGGAWAAFQPTLAETLFTPGQLAAAIGIAVFPLPTINLIRPWGKPVASEVGPQPFKVQKAPEFVERAELDMKLQAFVTTEELNSAERRIEDKLVQNFRELDHKRSVSIGHLHEHLTGTKQSVAEVKAISETHTQQLASVDQKLTLILRSLPTRP